MSLYTSIGGVRKEITKLYAGVGGTARQLTSFLAGVGGTKKELLPSQITYRWIQYNAIASTTTGKTGRAIYNYILRGDVALDGGEEIQTLYLTESEFYDYWTYGNGEFGQTYIMMQSGNDIEMLEFVGWETTTTTTYRQGTTNYGYVYSTNYNAYPNDGYQGGYWYVRSSGSGGGTTPDPGGGGSTTCSHSNTKTAYTSYSSTQHTVTKTCKDCGMVISSSKAAHQLNYGTAYVCPDCGTAVQRTYCSLCGYEKTGSHSC